MAKIKMIYLQDDLHAMLAECDNASALVSQLLRQHFELTKPKTKEEIKRLIAIEEIQEEANRKIEELRNAK